MPTNVTFSFAPPVQQRRFNTYRREELERMTLFQLRDICETENLVNANLDQMDCDALIHYILTFRGSREALLVNELDEQAFARLQDAVKNTNWNEYDHDIRIPAKLSLYEGLDTNYFDNFAVSYQEDIESVNALVVDRENTACALMRIISVPGKQDLFLARLGAFPCRTVPVQDYSLLIFPQALSDEVTRLYNGEISTLPDEAFVYRVPLLKFEIHKPINTNMPLAVDFGTTNTAAGLYIGQAMYSKIEQGIQPDILKPESINYVTHLTLGGSTTPILPTVIGVDRIENGKPVYNVGYAAEQMALNSYINEGFCVFYDIKRWVDDYETEEQVTDTKGNIQLVPRKEIIKAYLEHIIACAEQRFKCKFTSLFLSYPVKQRERFVNLYRELFPDYNLLESEMFDEGISVLYDIIGNLVDSKQFQEGGVYRALILDCGGGTTDQSSAAFRISKSRVAYNIDIETSYENGDTDFGGNNLTYRIMQLLKVEAAHQYEPNKASLQEVLAGFNIDVYRAVDDEGVDAVYAQLEAAYKAAEEIIPTKYKDYEYKGRDEYYMARNNFYFLFLLAERVKKAFFEEEQVLRIAVGSQPMQTESDTMSLQAGRWKMAVRGLSGLAVQKDFPTVVLNGNQVKSVFKADIYDIIRRFFGRLYHDKTLSQYNIVKLTGQSCKIDLFRDAIKEYVPGILIKQGKDKVGSHYELKLSCLDGAIRYLRDKHLGYANVSFKVHKPSLPYVLSAFSHDGEKIVLVHPLDREKVYGSVSRNMVGNEVQLTLEDTKGKPRYRYEIECASDSFEHKVYEDIKALYGEHIPQVEVDVIENGEVRYFVWADASSWGFSIVPVLRRDGDLYLGPQQLYSFENDEWVQNYFDGKH